jgi:hypothetical protein
MSNIYQYHSDYGFKLGDVIKLKQDIPESNKGNRKFLYDNRGKNVFIISMNYRDYTEPNLIAVDDLLDDFDMFISMYFKERIGNNKIHDKIWDEFDFDLLTEYTDTKWNIFDMIREK